METVKKIISGFLRPFFLALIFAILFTLSWMFGFGLDTERNIFIEYDLLYFGKIFIITCLSAFFLFKILPFAEKLIAKININFIDELFFKPTKKSFWLCFLFISLCHLPVFIAYFPGAFTYDTYHQAHFFFDNNPIEINPLAHNYLIYWTLLFSQKFNTPIWGVFLFTLFQSLITIGAFSYCINFLSKYKTAFLIKAMALLFFAIYPSHSVFHMIATKDAVYAPFFLLFTVFLAEMITDKKEFFVNNKRVFWFIFFTCLSFLFRLNGIVIYLFILPFIMFYLIKTCAEQRKKAIITLIIPLIFYLGYGELKNLAGVIPPHVASALSAPLQQMGRIRSWFDAELEQEDKNLFEEIMPGRAFAYDSACVDALKVDDWNMHSYTIEKFYQNRKKEFWQLYFKWGKKYPKEYVNGFFATGYPYWYQPYLLEPNDLHYYLFTYNRWDDFWGIKIEERNYIPKLRKLYDRLFLKSDYNRNPVLFMLFSLAVNTWLIILSFFILIYKKRYDLFLTVFSLFVSLLLAIAGPIALFRYVYPHFVLLPILWAYCFGSFDGKKSS